MRAVNARGVRSEWSEELPGSTRQVPLRCGGRVCVSCASLAPLLTPNLAVWLQGPGYVWDQTPEGVEVELLLPDETFPRDVAVEVKPARVRVTLRGTSLLEGRLGGEVLSEEGEWEWELCSPSLLHEPPAVRILRITLTKRQVSYEPVEQWSSLLVGDAHPLIDTKLLSWTRDRPWRPAQDARTRVCLLSSRAYADMLTHAPGGGCTRTSRKHHNGQASE